MGVRTEGCNTTCRVTAFGPDTNPSCLHLTTNQQQLENQTVVVGDEIVSGWYTVLVAFSYISYSCGVSSYYNVTYALHQP